MISLDIDYSEFEASLQGAMTRIGPAAGRIVKEQAEEIMEVSKSQVPSETGALLSTAFVESESGFMNGSTSFGYSGQAVNSKTGEAVSDYMVAVHERLDLEHPNGKAKFLEDPITEFMDNAESSLGSKVSDIISSIFGR